MPYRSKLLINIGVMFLSFSYAINGYVGPSILFGIISILYSVTLHSWKSFVRKYLYIILISLGNIYLSHTFHLDIDMPSFNFLIVANVTTMYVMSDSSFSTLRYVLKIVSGIALTMLCFYWIMPYHEFFYEILVILYLIFSPIFLAYVHKVFLHKVAYTKQGIALKR